MGEAINMLPCLQGRETQGRRMRLPTDEAAAACANEWRQALSHPAPPSARQTLRSPLATAHSPTGPMLTMMCGTRGMSPASSAMGLAYSSGWPSAAMPTACGMAMRTADPVALPQAAKQWAPLCKHSNASQHSPAIYPPTPIPPPPTWVVRYSEASPAAMRRSASPNRSGMRCPLPNPSPALRRCSTSSCASPCRQLTQRRGSQALTSVLTAGPWPDMQSVLEEGRRLPTPNAAPQRPSGAHPSTGRTGGPGRTTWETVPNNWEWRKGSHQFQSPAMAQAQNGSGGSGGGGSGGPQCAHRPSCSQVVFGKGLPVGQGCRSQRWHIGARHRASFSCRNCEIVTNHQAKDACTGRHMCSFSSGVLRPTPPARTLPPQPAVCAAAAQVRTEVSPSRIACFKSPMCRQQVTQASIGWLDDGAAVGPPPSATDG